MKDVEIIGMLKSYIGKTLVGMGALKGAPCTVKSVEDSGSDHIITLEWTDNTGVKRTTEFTVSDGAAGAQGPAGPTGATGADGEDGADGFSPKITVKTSTGDTYILTIETADGSFDTPNLKGSGGGGGASALSDLSDVDLTGLAAGDILIYQVETVDDEEVGFWVVGKPLSQISVNGVSQTISAGAVDLNVADNLITETQWTAINGLYA